VAWNEERLTPRFSATIRVSATLSLVSGDALEELARHAPTIWVPQMGEDRGGFLAADAARRCTCLRAVKAQAWLAIEILMGRETVDMVAQVILFENAFFEGHHKHVFEGIENLSVLIDPFNFNDKTTSIVVIEGEWQFFKDFKYENPFPNILGPGIYSNIAAALGLANANDTITGLRPVETFARKPGAPAGVGSVAAHV
jgi:hypothetical protein